MNHNFNINFNQHHINPQHCHQITSSIDHDKGVKPAHHLTAGGSIAMALIVALAISVTSTYVTPQWRSSQTCPAQQVSQVSREFEGKMHSAQRMQMVSITLDHGSCLRWY